MACQLVGMKMFNPKHPHDSSFHFPTQCYFLKLNGLWPVSDNKVRGFRYDFFTFLYGLLSWLAILDVVFVLYCAVSYMITAFGDLILLTENLCSSLMGFLMLSRMLHLRASQGNLRDILGLFVKDIWIAKGSSPRIEHECQQKMKPYRVMAVLMYSLVVMYGLVPLIQATQLGWDSQEKPYPYRMIFPYDAQRRWPYVMSFFVAVYSAVIGGSTLVAEDSLIGFFITYTCGQYQILHERIDNIIKTAVDRVRRADGNVDEARLQCAYLMELNDIAHKHNKLIEFVASLENTISFVLLVNFAFSTALLCLVGFQLVTSNDMIFGDYVKFAVYICASLSQLFVLCWNGDRLIQISAKTADHLYACNWEGVFPEALSEQQRQCYLHASKEFRQHLQIMIMCSQRPVQVTAGKLSTISLQSFSRLLSSSMSYFTVLQTMYRGES